MRKRDISRLVTTTAQLLALTTKDDPPSQERNSKSATKEQVGQERNTEEVQSSTFRLRLL
jgi:hypothetical protein